MQLTLLRHIQTLAPEGTCYGQSEPELPSDHELQHRHLARALDGETFHAIYSSPLQRCALLAETIAGPRPVTYDDRLKEIDFGSWEGLPWSEIEQRPEAAPFFADWVHTPPPGGEPFIDLIARVGCFLAEIGKRHRDHHLLVVSHSGPIRAILGLAEHLPPEDFFKRSLPFGHISRINL